MGFLDTVKGKAGAIVAEAERAGKVTAAQARLVVLQNDLRKAERELGHTAFTLAQGGDLDHPGLSRAIERLRDITAEVLAKEAEIATIRGRTLEQPAAAPSAGPVRAGESPVPYAATPPDTPAADTPAAPTPSAKAAAKKSAAGKADSERGKTRAGHGAAAGTTPKKVSRPSSTGPRPGGKKRPAGS